MPKIIKEDLHTATVQLDDAHRSPVVIAKRNPDGSHNSTYMALSHHDMMRGYSGGGEVEKSIEDPEATPDKPSPITGGYCGGGMIKGYADGGEVIDDAPAVGADMMAGQSPADLQAAMVAQANPQPAAPTAPMPLTTPGTIADASVPLTQPQQPQVQGNPYLVPKNETKTTTINPGYSSNALNQVGQDNQAEQRAVTAVGAIDAKEKQDEAAAHLKAAGLSQQDATDAAKHAQGVQDWTNAYEQNMQKNIEAYQNAKIVPKSIFEDGNIGQNVAAGLSLAMGALGGALTGTHQNVALDIFNKAIDRDMEAQRANLEKQGQVTNMLGMYYKTALDMGASAQQAKSYASGKALETINQQLQSSAAATGSQRAIANAQLTGAKLQSEADIKKAEATRQQTTNESSSTQIMNPMVMDVPQANADKMQQIENDTTLMKDFRDVAMKNNLAGPAKARVMGMLSKVGMASNSWEEAQSKLANLSQDQIGDISSRFGPEVQNSVKSTLADLNKRPEVFKQQADQFLDTQASKYYNLAGNIKMPKNYQYKRLGTPNDDAYAQKFGVNIPGSGQPTTQIPFTKAKR